MSAWTKPRAKPELLLILGDLVHRTRAVGTIAPYWFMREVDDFTQALTEIETELGNLTDELMAARYRAHNTRTHAAHAAVDSNGLSGRWGRWGQRVT